jgi:hypothetical protein
MDNSIAKWLVRVGSLLIVVGVFLPSVAVSCTAMGVTQTQSFSMNDLAGGSTGQPLLYLVLLGALAAVIVAFIPARDKQQFILYLLGQMAGLGLGVLSILIVILSLSRGLQQYGMQTSMDYGFFFLLFGYGLGGAGIAIQFLQYGQYAPSPPNFSVGASPGPDIGIPQLQYSPPPQPTALARLQLVQGNAPRLVQIQETDFTIGRSGRSQLRLNDSQVSGTHVRLRFAQGAWFIQDQDSSNGTFVNGKKIKAQRLNDGDQIRLGEITYIFHS